MAKSKKSSKPNYDEVIKLPGSFGETMGKLLKPVKAKRKK